MRQAAIILCPKMEKVRMNSKKVAIRLTVCHATASLARSWPALEQMPEPQATMKEMSLPSLRHRQ